MVDINQLTTATSIADGDLMPIYSSQNGDARKVSITLLRQTMQANAASTDDKITQYAAPSATGFSVILTDGPQSIWLILTPVAGYAAGTLMLPSVGNAIDRQEILVNCTQSVTALTINGNGAAAVTGAPTTLAANAKFRLRYDALTKSWYGV